MSAYDLLTDEMPETLEEAQAAYEEEMQEDDAEEFLKELKISSLHT